MALVKHRNQTIIWLLFRSEEVKRPWHYRIGPPRNAPFPTEPLNSSTWRATASLMSGRIFGWALWTLFGKPRINVTVFGLFLTTFLNWLFFNTCAVTWLCALLYDDVGGAIRHDLSEGGQCCSGSPESSFHPTALSVSNSASYRASERLKKFIMKWKSQNKYHIMSYQSEVYLTVLLNITFPLFPVSPRVYRRCLVPLWCQTPKRDQISTGFLTRYRSWKPKPLWCDMWVCWIWAFLGNYSYVDLDGIY